MQKYNFWKCLSIGYESFLKKNVKNLKIAHIQGRFQLPPAALMRK